MEESEQDKLRLTRAGWILVTGIVIAVLIIGSSIYWFGLRPYYGRKDCNNLATSQSNGYSIGPYYTEVYQACLNSKGL